MPPPADQSDLMLLRFKLKLKAYKINLTPLDSLPDPSAEQLEQAESLRSEIEELRDKIKEEKGREKSKKELADKKKLLAEQRVQKLKEIADQEVTQALESKVTNEATPYSADLFIREFRENIKIRSRMMLDSLYMHSANRNQVRISDISISSYEVTQFEGGVLFFDIFNNSGLTSALTLNDFSREQIGSIFQKLQEFFVVCDVRVRFGALLFLLAESDSQNWRAVYFSEELIRGYFNKFYIKNEQFVEEQITIINNELDALIEILNDMSERGIKWRKSFNPLISVTEVRNKLVETLGNNFCAWGNIMQDADLTESEDGFIFFKEYYSETLKDKRFTVDTTVEPCKKHKGQGACNCTLTADTADTADTAGATVATEDLKHAILSNISLQQPFSQSPTSVNTSDLH